MDDLSLPRWETLADSLPTNQSQNPPAYSLHPSEPFDEELLGAVGGAPSVVDRPQTVVIHHHHHYHYHTSQHPQPAADRILPDLPTYDEATCINQPAPPAPFVRTVRPSAPPASSRPGYVREPGIPVIHWSQIRDSFNSPTADPNLARIFSNIPSTGGTARFGSSSSEPRISPTDRLYENPGFRVGFDLDALFDDSYDELNESRLEHIVSRCESNESCDESTASCDEPLEPSSDREEQLQSHETGYNVYDRPIADDILPRLTNISATRISEERKRVKKAILAIIWQLKQFHPELTSEEAWLRLCTRLIEEGDFERREEVAIAWEFAFRLSPSVHFKSLYASSIREILEMMRSD